MALIPESQVDARTAPIYQQYPDIETTILAGAGEIQLHFLCSKPTLAEAQARVDELTGKVEAEMDDTIFSSHGDSLEEIVLLNLGIATSPSAPPSLHRRPPRPAHHRHPQQLPHLPRRSVVCSPS